MPPDHFWLKKRNGRALSALRTMGQRFPHRSYSLNRRWLRSVVERLSEVVVVDWRAEKREKVAGGWAFEIPGGQSQKTQEKEEPARGVLSVAMKPRHWRSEQGREAGAGPSPAKRWPAFQCASFGDWSRWPLHAQFFPRSKRRRHPNLVSRNKSSL